MDSTAFTASTHTGSPVRSLYVHVPFCAHKCEYCAFYSALPKGDEVQRYVQALIQEMKWIAPRCKPDTIFFGGGTPTLLTLKQWEQILKAMDRLNLTGAAEWTVECNPATLSLDKARLLKESGVNRISMGVQSLDENLLDRLGRVHSRAMVFKSYDILRQTGFENVSIDLMFAIPTQTLDQWDRTLDEALALGTEHLSCYEVIYEEDTPLFHQLQAGKVDIDEDLACVMYDRLVERAEASGLIQYEIANFARSTDLRSAPVSENRIANRPGSKVSEVSPSGAPWILPNEPQIPERACRHNMGYWRGADSFGLGPSATEYVDGTRSRNWANTRMYCEMVESGRRPREFTETLASWQQACETAAFGLRMNAGWPFELFAQRTGYDLRTQWAPEIQEMIRRGWAETDPDRLALTPVGLRFADAAGALLLRDAPHSSDGSADRSCKTHSLQPGATCS